MLDNLSEFSALWRLFIGILGIVWICLECSELKNTFYDEGDRNWQSWGGHGWVALGILLVFQAFGFSTGDMVAGRHAYWAAQHGLDLSPILVLIAIPRLVLLRMTSFAPNKDKILATYGGFDLNGEEGVLVEDVSPLKNGKVRIHNPSFNNDILECISDDHIVAGTAVLVKEVECGLPRVVRIS